MILFDILAKPLLRLSISFPSVLSNSSCLFRMCGTFLMSQYRSTFSHSDHLLPRGFKRLPPVFPPSVSPLFHASRPPRSPPGGQGLVPWEAGKSIPRQHRGMVKSCQETFLAHFFIQQGVMASVGERTTGPVTRLCQSSGMGSLSMLAITLLPPISSHVTVPRRL